MSEAITRPPDVNPTADPGAAGSVLVVVVAWCAGLSHRVGEWAPFPDLGLERVLGRGAAARGEVPVEFAPGQLGEHPRATELDVDTLSRRLLRVTALSIGLDVTLLGRGPMRLAGKPATAGLVLPGETILIEDRLLLYVTRRPASIALRHFPPGHLGAFGQPDAFGMVGESERMMRLRDEAAFAARSGDHVLVLGETGAGKEAVARAVHGLSNRARRPFVAHNAAGLSDELAEIEIFGNEENFPNPPMKARPGLVGEADGGTLYFDEIGELPQVVQAKLLRVLDEQGQYRRLGDTRSRNADLRMVGATNRPLDQPRPDFVARYKVRVEVPGLRERAEDIPLLVQHRAMQLIGDNPSLVSRFVEQLPDGSRGVRIAPDLVETLVMADHPANVRGLDIVLWAAIGRSIGSTVRASAEQLEALRPAPEKRPSVYLLPDGRMRDLTPAEVADLRSRYDGTRGATSRLAEELGVSRFQLRRALKRHGLAELPGEELDDAP